VLDDDGGVRIVSVDATAPPSTDPNHPPDGSMPSHDDDGGMPVTPPTRDAGSADGPIGPPPPPPPMSCPSGRGPDMIKVTSVGQTYCVDATEVTLGQYDEFIATSPDLDDQPPECAFNRSFGPQFQVADKNMPVQFVDWCDARAFCRWAGKHLCGKIGGGPSAFDAWQDATSDEWFGACSEGGMRAFPYGQQYERVCRDDNDNRGGGDQNMRVTPVKTHPACEGGVAGLFDMSGNVKEWADSCDENDNCRVRGGGAYDRESNLRCAADDRSPRSHATADDIGVRCCAALR
jgi:formylglycine-generating enzyme required for sulfatase activity